VRGSSLRPSAELPTTAITMSPSPSWAAAGNSKWEPPAKSMAPTDAAAFAGQWTDSLGNGVHVVVANDTPAVTLTKRHGGSPIMLKLSWDSYSQGWWCGNGFMGDVVYQDNTDKSKGKTLQLISWVTKDGRVSTWFRATLGPSGPSEKARWGAVDECVGEASPTQAEENVVASICTAVVAPPASQPVLLGSAKSIPKEEVALKGAKLSRFRESWADATEEWESTTKATEFLGGIKPQEQTWTDSKADDLGEAPKSRSSRRGHRRRPGRAVHP